MVSRSAMDGVTERAVQQREILSTEEATKHALVLPFIQALGYDVFDPREVVPEFTADYGLKNGEKVDYAVMRDGEPALLFECKKVDDPLDVGRASQLARYFHTTKARIAILTDGVIYKFFSDLDAENTMDSTPFLEVDVTRLESRDFTSLHYFSKPSFDVNEARSAAANMKYIRGMKAYLVGLYSQPDEEFVRLLSRKVFSGPLFQSRIESFTGLTKLAFQGFVNDRISDTLQKASAIVNTSSETRDTSEEPRQEHANDIAENEETDEGRKGIMTTVEEVEGYEMVKTLLSEIVDPERIAIRDTQNYCGVLLDDNNRKVICRLYFNRPKTKYIGLFDGERDDIGRQKETRYLLQSIDDIANHADQLRTTVQRLLEG